MKPEDKATIQKTICLAEAVILPALRQLLEQPEPAQSAERGEPVARVIDDGTPEGATEWIPFANRVEPLKTGDLLYTRAQPAVPEGYKLVPMEPTEEMINAALADRNYSGGVPGIYYRAMIAAAPAQPAVPMAELIAVLEEASESICASARQPLKDELRGFALMLAAAQPAALVELTDEEIKHGYRTEKFFQFCFDDDFERIVRWTTSKIKEKNT